MNFCLLFIKLLIELSSLNTDCGRQMSWIAPIDGLHVTTLYFIPWFSTLLTWFLVSHVSHFGHKEVSQCTALVQSRGWGGFLHTRTCPLESLLFLSCFSVITMNTRVSQHEWGETHMHMSDNWKRAQMSQQRPHQTIPDHLTPNMWECPATIPVSYHLEANCGCMTELSCNQKAE